MITKEQLQEMFALQEQLEIRIDGEDWRNKGHDYPLCVHMECAEIVDHIGWKHWKNVDAEPDWDAVAMEIVDVWHFLLAHWLQNLGPDLDVEPIYEAMLGCEVEEDAYLPHVCIGIGFAIIVNGQVPMGNLVTLMNAARMSWEQLYRLYIGKNVLNRFRQDHGYRDGSYRKTWDGEEDNVHLFKIAVALNDEEFSYQKLYDALDFKYQMLG